MFKKLNLILFVFVSLLLGGCGSDHGTDDGNSKNDPVLEEIKITPPAITIPKGASLPLKATGYYSDGTTADITQSVEWNVNDEGKDIIKVDKFPDNIVSVKGNTLGDAFISAKMNRLVSPKVAVKVTDAKLVQLEIQQVSVEEDNSPPFINIPVTYQVLLHAVGKYSDGSTHDLTDSVNWESDIQRVVTIENSDGDVLVTGNEFGETAIRANIGKISVWVRVKITDAKLTKIEAHQLGSSASSFSVPKEHSISLTAVGIFSDDTRLILPKNDVTWEISEKDIAEGYKRESYFILSGKKVGNIDLTAKFKKISGSYKVEVTEVTLDRIEIRELGTNSDNPSGDISIINGWAAPLRIVEVYSDDSTINVTYKATLHVMDPDVAYTLKSDYIFTINGIKPGYTYFSATIGGQTSQVVRVEVSEESKLEGIQIETNEISIVNGSYGEPKATGFYSDGTEKDISHAVTWVSKEPDLITVASYYLMASTTKVGTTTVTAKKDNMVSSEITVTVISPN